MLATCDPVVSNLLPAPCLARQYERYLAPVRAAEAGNDGTAADAAPSPPAVVASMVLPRPRSERPPRGATLRSAGGCPREATADASSRSARVQAHRGVQ
jgi:hypothetical protein